MGQNAERVKDYVVYGTTAHLSENLDSFPGLGLGLKFMKRSAEKVMVDRVEERLLPRLDRHLENQFEFIQELSEADGEVGEEYRERLLESDPLWDVLDAEGERREEGRGVRILP